MDNNAYMQLNKEKVLLLLVLLLFIPYVSATKYEVNGTVYYPLYNGTYSQNHIEKMDYNFTTGDFYMSFDSGKLRLLNWTGGWPNDYILNPETDQPVSMWSGWKAESYRTSGQGSWIEMTPLTHQFVVIDEKTLMRSMTTTSGGMLNITYRLQDGKLKFIVNRTAGTEGRAQRVRYEVDFINGQGTFLNNSKRFNPGFNYTVSTLWDYNDILTPAQFNSSIWYGGYNISQEITQGGSRYNFIVDLNGSKVMQNGRCDEFDPSWSTNGTTSPIWQNVIYDNTTVNGNTTNNIVIGNTADFFNRPNSSVIGGLWTRHVSDTSSIENNQLKITSAGYNTYYNNNFLTQPNISFSYGENDSDFFDSDKRFRVGFFTQSGTTTYWTPGYYIVFYPYYSQIKLKRDTDTQIGSTATGKTFNSTDIITIVTSSMSTGLMIYKNGILWHTFSGNSSYSNGFIYFSSGDGANPSPQYFLINNFHVWNTTKGSVISWLDSGSGNETYQIDVNVTTPINTNYSLSVYNNNTREFIESWTNLTGNQSKTITGTKAQDTNVNITFYGNTIASPELIGVTFYSQTASAGSSTYMPPFPVSLANTSGNFWVNYTWVAGDGNITDFYNVSITNNSVQSWINGTATTFLNSTLAAGQWSNISVFAFNSSGTGTLNATSANMNTKTNSCSANITYDGTKITWSSGWANPLCINQQIANNSLFLQNNTKEWIPFVPIELTGTASYYINSTDTNELKLDSANGSRLIVSSGLLDIRNTTVSSWNNTLKLYSNVNDTFRSSITSKNTGQIIIDNVTTNNLGKDSWEQEGIHISGSGSIGTTINNLHTNNSYKGIYIYDVNNVSITNSIINNSYWRGIELESTNNTTILNTQINIIDSFVESDRAIYLNAANYTIVNNNTILENDGIGILLVGSANNNNLSSNHITDGIFAIQLSNSFNNIINSNIINDTYSEAINIQSLSYGNNLSNNRINHSEKGFVIANSYLNMFYNNNITYSVDDGIQLMHGANNNSFYYNNVYNNSGGGVWLFTDTYPEISISDNYFESNYIADSKKNVIDYYDYIDVPDIAMDNTNNGTNNTFKDTTTLTSYISVMYDTGYIVKGSLVYSDNRLIRKHNRNVSNITNISYSEVYTSDNVTVRLEAPPEMDLVTYYYRTIDYYSLNGYLVPVEAVNVTVVTWSTTGNKSKSFSINSSNITQSVNLTIGDLNVTTNYSIKKDGVLWQTKQSNSTGWIPEFSYNGGLNATISIEEEDTFPVSITNYNMTTWNFGILNQWTNPISDFDHIEVRNITTDALLTNLSNTSWNRTLTPHYTQNISYQIVDATGNVNQTKIWFNATIPNNLPLIGNYTNAACWVSNACYVVLS